MASAAASLPSTSPRDLRVSFELEGCHRWGTLLSFQESSNLPWCLFSWAHLQHRWIASLSTLSTPRLLHQSSLDCFLPADPTDGCSGPVAVVAPVAATVQVPAVSGGTIFVIWNNDYLTVTVMMFDVNNLTMYNNATIVQVRPCVHSSEPSTKAISKPLPHPGMTTIHDTCRST